MRSAPSSGLPPVTDTSAPPQAARHRQRQFGRARAAGDHQRLERREGGDQVGVQQLAVGHRDQHVRGAGVKADQRAALGAPGRQAWRGGASAAGEVTIGQERRRSGPARPAPLRTTSLLPAGDEGVGGVLQLAAAAGAGMAAGRAGPGRARA